MTRSGRPAPVPARRPVRGGRSLSYAGSAQRIFMIRRRADSRAAELVLTSVAVAAVLVTWTLITLQLIIAWLWSEIFDDKDERRAHGLAEIDSERGRLQRRSRRHARQLQRELFGDHGEKPAGRLIQRTASAVDELGPAVEAVAAAWQRGKHAAGQQAAELAGRSSELVGDADREALITELQQHMMAGRLTIAEFEERVGVAHGARTRGDIERARAQLPRPPSPPRQ